MVPPDTGIVHQVNLEYLARVVFTGESKSGPAQAYPDTLVGTDSHTTMVNGLGVLGWGVGGIEAEAAMLGQPLSMLIPQVVGFRLHGKLREGSTATDLVLTVTEILRKAGVVGKFVEFFGPGVATLSLADRATIANMAPEYGATCGIFPIDDETLRYLRLTGRSAADVELVEAYAREQGFFHGPTTPEAEYSSVSDLDLASVEPSVAGPKRPQDRVSLFQTRKSFEDALPSLAKPKAKKKPAAADAPLDVDTNVGYAPASKPSPDVKNGSVVIAAITSCTNTSNPSVLVAAGLLAKKAVEKGLSTKPWVKTSLAPGSKVVTEYLAEAGLTPYLEQLKFHTVGYGCTTCIGNSGPLPQSVADAIDVGDLVVASVLSGNRNFEGRINPDVRANYLMSPPLVVAYALAGRIDIDLDKEPLGRGQERRAGVPARHLAVLERGERGRQQGGQAGDVPEDVRGRVRRRRALAQAGRAARADVRLGCGVDVHQGAAVFRRHHQDAGRGERHQGRARAGGAGRQRDHRPHLARGQHQEGRAGREVPDRARRGREGLQQLRRPPRQPRGDGARHVRQRAPQEPARARNGRRRDAAPARRRADVDLRGEREVRGGGRAAGRSSRARNTEADRRATGRRRGRGCSACAS